MSELLHRRINQREADIGVVGLGYVGLPLAVSFADNGFSVTGVDVDEDRLRRVGRGDADTSLATASYDSVSERLDLTDNYSQLSACEVVVCSVPTPVADGTPDLSHLERAVRDVAAQWSPGEERLLVIASTVTPGTCRNTVSEILTEYGLGESTYVAAAPERLNPGSSMTIEEIPVVVGADSSTGQALVEVLFESVTDTHRVDTTIVAEASKVMENTYRFVNIALIYELAMLSEDAGINVWETVEAAGTKPFGFQAFYPGPGIGGHCIPVDPHFFTALTDKPGEELRLIRDASDANDRLLDRISSDIRELAEETVDEKQSSVTVLGATYKPDVGDLRRSGALQIVDQLSQSELSVTVVEPHVDSLPVDEVTHLTELTDELFREPSAFAVLVDHASFDFRQVADEAEVVYDAKNVVPDDGAATVVTLGDGSGPRVP